MTGQRLVQFGQPGIKKFPVGMSQHAGQIPVGQQLPYFLPDIPEIRQFRCRMSFDFIRDDFEIRAGGFAGRQSKRRQFQGHDFMQAAAF